MKSPFDRSSFKALAQGVAGKGGLGALMESTLVGWRAAQALKGAPSSSAKSSSRRLKSKRRALFGGKAKAGGKAGRRTSASASQLKALFQPRHGRLEAVGWFLVAGVILAWPRDHSPFEWSFLKRQLTPPPAPGSEALAAEAAQPGRGRMAQHPGQIPLRGWRDIFWRAWNEFTRDNIPQVAGGVAFFGLLAVFPAMAAFVSLYGLFFDPTTVQKQISVLSGVLPSEALGLVTDQLTRLGNAPHSGLGLAFVSGLLLSLWSSNAGMKAMMVGLNISFEEKEKRKFLELNLVSLAFTLGGLVFVLLTATAVILVPIVLAFVGYKGSGLAVLRWPALLLIAIGALAVLYRYGPSRRREKWRWVSWGSAFAAILWLAASLLFSIYVANFGNYDKTYGSLGAVVGFMSWMWISVITVLFGAEINSEIEHQTAVDTTAGHAKPMGTRGAYMADTLGKARPSGDKAALDAGPDQAATAGRAAA